MNRIISIWLCFVLVASSVFVLVVDEAIEGKVIVSDGSAGANYPLMELQDSIIEEDITSCVQILNQNQVNESFDIPISGPGWNFISFPINISGNIELVLNDSISGDDGTTWDVARWYNPLDAADPWKTHRVGASTNDLTTINNTMGVWIHISGNGGDRNLTTGLNGSYPEYSSIPLYAGWNMVGYPACNGTNMTAGEVRALTGHNVTEILTYEGNSSDLNQPTENYTSLIDTDYLTIGRACWFNVTENCTWEIDFTAPAIDAGLNVSANSEFTQNATATDSGSGIAIYLWTIQSGPGSITFGTPDAEDTTILADTDGTYIIRLNVTDNVGNGAYDEFTLIWDTASPDIILNSPTNNTIIPRGTVLDFYVIDDNIDNVNWTLIATIGTWQIHYNSLASPYDVVADWNDDIYQVKVEAIDQAGYSAIEIYEFMIDETPPNVEAGSQIATNMQIFKDAISNDTTSGIAIYQWTKQSGPGTITFGTPNAEDTTIEADVDGTYVIRLNVIDNAGNWAIDNFTLIWDTNSPLINLNSPANDTIIHPGTIIDIDVIDDGINIVNYSVNGGLNLTLNPSYVIDTTGWAEDTYIIDVHAIDYAGNTAVEIYEFTIDSPPTVDAGSNLTTNTQFLQNATTNDTGSGIASYNWTKISGTGTITFENASMEDTNISANLDGLYVIQLNVTDNAGNWAVDNFTLVWDTTPPVIIVSNAINGTGIWFNVTDDNLDSVYYLNGTSNTTSISPCFINTSSLTPGWYNYTIRAFDLAGNSASTIVPVYIEPAVITPVIVPTITSTVPAHGATSVSTATDIVITFSQPMNTTSIQNALGMTKLTSNMTLSFSWNADNTTLTLTLGPRLDPVTTYSVIIDTGARDANGTAIAGDYSFSFTTFIDTDEDGIPDTTDSDDDGDGTPDATDAFPLDSTETIDTDGDGVGNNADPDDDNDLVADEYDLYPLDKTRWDDGGSGIGDYLWVILVILAVVAGAIIGFMFMGKKASTAAVEEENLEEEEIEEDELEEHMDTEEIDEMELV